MEAINLRSFAQKVRRYKRSFSLFLTKVEKAPPRKLNQIVTEIDKTIWPETDCLTCGNCCKKMTPTFSPSDLKRISAHLNMTQQEFKDKWLVYMKKDKEWHNKKQPCQFLDLKDNKCSIYEVRPSDCAGFPHLAKNKVTDYIYIHKQNIEYCPATFKMVERLKAKLQEKA